MTNDCVDVVIVGGGPAGTATAIALAHAGRSVAVLERSHYGTTRIGETLPPGTRVLFQQLGVWERFVAAAHAPSPGTLAVWGDEGPTIVRWLRGGGIGVTSMGLGTIFPLLSSATGQVFVTYLPPRTTRAQLKRELGNQDPSSPETAARIEAIKARVRESGFAWLKGHFVENIRGAAAPVFDSQGELVAVLALAGPDRRSSDGRDPSVAALTEAARQVTQQLSGR